MSQDGWREGGDGRPESCLITLAVPCPESDRATNLYVDTPFPHHPVPRRSAPPLHHHHTDLPLVHHPPRSTSNVKRPTKSLPATAIPYITHPITTTKTATTTTATTPSSRVVSKQPTKTFTKVAHDDSEDICALCGRCRCQMCRIPRHPPFAWLCHDKCLCSPVVAVDYASCLCCVKGVLYHCGKDGSVGLAEVADNPCSCTGGRGAALGWACLALAAIPLPCLLCYWPLTGVRRVLEAAYQRGTSHGCRCPQGRPPRLSPSSQPLQLQRGVQDVA